MFQFLKSLFRPARSNGRRSVTQARLCLETLEAREVPATLPLTSVGPQPEPPTKVEYAKILFPVFKPVGHISSEFRPTSPVMILLPSLKPGDRLAILKPIGNTNPEIIPIGNIRPELNR